MEQCPLTVFKENLLCAWDRAHSKMILATKSDCLELQCEFMIAEKSDIQTESSGSNV